MINVNELACYMKIADIAEWTPILQVACSYVDDRIKKYCGQSITESETTEYYDGNGERLLMVRKFPLTTITDIAIAATELDVHTALASDTYNLINRNGVYYAYSKNGFAKGNGNVRLTYTSGYNDVPQDVKKVAYEMAAIVVKNSDFEQSMKGGRLGIHQINENIQGAAATTTFKDLWKEWRRELTPYKVPRY